MKNLPVGDAPSKLNPYFSKLLVNRLMTQGSKKETRHFELSLKNSGMRYSPGDSLGIIPQNCVEVVQELLQAVGLSGEEVVRVAENDMVLSKALQTQLACTKLSKIQIKKFNDIAQSKKLSELLLLSNKNELINYMWGRELIDLFLEFPQPNMDSQTFVSLMRPIPPRFYSISSSLIAHPDEVHLTVEVLRYVGYGRLRWGVCSTYLAERVGEHIPCYLHPNKNFKLPEDSSTPVIMVGPGTGIAPFRSFLQERKETGASGRNWLFFGNRNMKTDFLYAVEWKTYQKDGILDRLDLAWSRDQESKVYVQHKMLEKKREVWNWLQKGAVFYVCGDASRMAKDVDIALRKIVEEEGGMSEEDAVSWVKTLIRERRYLKDVY